MGEFSNREVTNKEKPLQIIPDALVAGIKERRVILFVGAGVSMNLGLPSSQQIVSHIGEELGFTGETFQNLGDYQTLVEYYELEKQGTRDLRNWLDAACHPEVADVCSSPIHSSVVELDFPTIYTTNY